MQTHPSHLRQSWIWKLIPGTDRPMEEISLHVPMGIWRHNRQRRHHKSDRDWRLPLRNGRRPPFPKVIQDSLYGQTHQAQGKPISRWPHETTFNDKLKVQLHPQHILKFQSQTREVRIKEKVNFHLNTCFILLFKINCSLSRLIGLI